MSKKQVIAYVAIFNALMIVAFIFSNIYIWDFLTTQINGNFGYTLTNGIVTYTEPHIRINGFQVSVGIVGARSDGGNIPTPVPLSVPNYPFYVFWVAIVGNLVLMFLILRNLRWKKQTKNTVIA
jgi:hypothetical protein